MRLPQFWPAERDSGFYNYGQSKRRLLFSYLPDWLFTLILAGGFYALDNVVGYRREFSLADTSLRHPYAVHERVPNGALWLISFVAPFVLQLIVNFFTIRSWWDFHNGSLGLTFSLVLTGVITQFSKVTVGRPRPDIIDRCQPPAGSVDPPFGLTNASICTQTDQVILIDGFRSFPSGHSSMSAAGLGFFAFYLAGKLHLFDRRGYALKAWISITPLFAAVLVAISRTMDYRHHWSDVTVGLILGFITAYFSYRQYYPGLASQHTHRPFGPRVEQESNHLPLHNRQSSADHLHSAMPPRIGGLPYEDEDQTELIDGTVQRPRPLDLQDVWKASSG